MATGATTPATAITWKVDPAHSSAEFKVKHMMISNVKGRMSGIVGTLSEHPADKTLSTVEATVDVATLTTGDAQRDAHLKSADFFDMEKFPKLTFKSNKVERKDESEYRVTGDLTVHGITKPVTFNVEGPSTPAKDPWGNTRIGLSATARINRKDFGLNWNTALETGGFLVGEEVIIELDVQFIRASQ